MWKGGGALVVGINLGDEAATRALLDQHGLAEAPVGTSAELKEMSWLESVVDTAGERAGVGAGAGGVAAHAGTRCCVLANPGWRAVGCGAS